MSNKRTKKIILILAASQVILILGLLSLPVVVQAIPGRYRVALSERSPFLSGFVEGVIDQVAPVAESLPAPIQVTTSTTSQVDISALIAVESTEAPTAVPTATTAPTAAPTAEPDLSTQATATLAASPTPAPTDTPTVTPTATPKPLPERVELEGVELVRQTFNNCGPANLTQVLNFHNYDITQEEVRSYLKPNSEDRNVSPWQIEEYVNSQTTYRAIARSNGNIMMVKQFIAAGLPVVIEKGYELPSTGWWGHYLTVYGYDDTRQEFYSRDTYLGDGTGRIDPYEEMESFWQQFNYTFYVVYPPAQEELVYSILGEDMVDDFTMWQLTAARAQAETTEDPENEFAWFNLGTALTRMGELTGKEEYYLGGAQAFDQARQMGLPPRMLWYQFRPYFAYFKVGRFDDVIDLANATLETQGGRNVEETYWHKGHALLALGDLFGARTAYETALEVNENFSPAQISLDYVISLGG